jgi:DNA polymerase-1
MEVIVERREDNKKRFIIIDGSSLMYRAFFALPLLTSSSGIYTNAIMGFSNMLGKILTEYKPDNIVVAFDKSRQTFRTQMYAEYKGQRKNSR